MDQTIFLNIFFIIVKIFTVVKPKYCSGDTAQCAWRVNG